MMQYDEFNNIKFQRESSLPFKVHIFWY